MDGTDTMVPLDPKFLETLVTGGMGASFGTLWRALTRPETDMKAFVIMMVVALTVGTIIGGAIIEYLNLHSFQAAGVASVLSFLSQEALMFFRARGEKLKQGKIDLSVGGDSANG